MKMMFVLALIAVSGAAHASLIDAKTEGLATAAMAEISAIKAGGYKVMDQYSGAMTMADVDHCEQMTAELVTDLRQGGNVQITAQAPQKMRFDNLKVAYDGVNSAFHLVREENRGVHFENYVVAEVMMNVWEHDGQRDAYLTCVKADELTSDWP